MNPVPLLPFQAMGRLDLHRQALQHWCPSDRSPSLWFSPFQAMGRLDLRKKASEMREWDEEELRMLDRALAKFPQVGGWVVERGGGE